MSQQLINVLLVGGEESAVVWLRQRLDDLGCEVHCAPNGAAALLAVHKERPDLVIAAAELPVLNGYQLLAVMRSHGEFRRVPVILLTRSSDENEISRAWAAGADLCVPLDQPQEEVLNTIARALATTYNFSLPPAWLEASLPSGCGAAR